MRKFECGHIRKGQFCHSCAALQAAKSKAHQDRHTRREAKQLAAASDGIDLSPVNHLKAVQREARALLERSEMALTPMHSAVSRSRPPPAPFCPSRLVFPTASCSTRPRSRGCVS
jgi:hypothetical protein